MKKLLALLLVGIMIFTIAACTSKPKGEDKTPEKQPEESKEPEQNKDPDPEPADLGWAPEVTEVPDEAKVASYADAFKGDTEQGPVWFYLSDDGEGFQELYHTPSWGDNWQYSDAAEANGVFYSLFEWEGLKASAGLWGETNVKIAIAWRAYKDGTAKIGEWDFSAYDGEANLEGFVPGAKVQILKGQEELFAGTTTDKGGDKFEGAEVEVKEGDIIFFVFDGKDAPAANYAVDTVSIELN